MSYTNPRSDSRARNLLNLLGCLGLLGCAFSIILLAGAAGWTQGQRQAEQTASAEQRHFINENCGHFAEDVQERRPVFLQRRYELLASMTPAPPCLLAIPATATALALQLAATDTPLPSPTAIAATATPSSAPTAQSTSIATHESTALANQLGVARLTIRDQDYPNAIAQLDAIRSADPAFAQSMVHSMLLYALRLQAAYLFSAGELAPAILLVNRAEDFGLEAEDTLRFSRQVATYYLDAQRWRDINRQRAIQNLENLMAVAPNYAPTGKASARSLLANLRVSYGDLLLAGLDACAAVSQFEAAIALVGDNGELAAKLSGAQTSCGLPPFSTESAG